VLATTGCLAMVTAGAVPALAAAKTLRFLQKPTSGQFLGPDGQPLADPSAIGPGASFDATDLDYAGNAKKHARTYTASDHIACTFMTTTTATCNAQIAIGASLLLADQVSLTLDFTSNAPIVVPINGGTGAYARARGTATSTSIPHSNNSNFVVKVR
jgi:hypothetical protein